MEGRDIPVGTLVRMTGTIEWNGQIGLVTKIPKTKRGMWVIRLNSGEDTFVATGRRDRIEVIG